MSRFPLLALILLYSINYLRQASALRAKDFKEKKRNLTVLSSNFEADRTLFEEIDNFFPVLGGHKITLKRNRVLKKGKGKGGKSKSHKTKHHSGKRSHHSNSASRKHHKSSKSSKSSKSNKPSKKANKKSKGGQMRFFEDEDFSMSYSEDEDFSMSYSYRSKAAHKYEFDDDLFSMSYAYNSKSKKSKATQNSEFEDDFFKVVEEEIIEEEIIEEEIIEEEIIEEEIIEEEVSMPNEPNTSNDLVSSIDCPNSRGGDGNSMVVKFPYSLETSTEDVEQVQAEVESEMVQAVAEDLCKDAMIKKVKSDPEDTKIGTCTPQLDENNFCTSYDGKMTIVISTLASWYDFDTQSVIDILKEHAESDSFEIDGLEHVEVSNDADYVPSSGVKSLIETDDSGMSNVAKGLIVIGAVCTAFLAYLLKRRSARSSDVPESVSDLRMKGDDNSFGTTDSEGTPTQTNCDVSPTQTNCDISPTQAHYGMSPTQTHYDMSPAHTNFKINPYGLRTITECSSEDKDRSISTDNDSTAIPVYNDLARICTSQNVHRCTSASCLSCNGAKSSESDVKFIEVPLNNSSSEI